MANDPATGLPSDTLPTRWAWSALILPFIDQSPLHNALQVTVGTSIPPPPSNQDAVAGVNDKYLSVFACPTDPSNREAVWGGTVFSRGRLDGYNKMNYPGCTGINGANEFQNLVHASDRRGVFSNSSNTRIQDITDGTSNTILCGEVRSDLACSEAWCGQHGSGHETRLGVIWMRADHRPFSSKFLWMSVLRETSRGAPLNGRGLVLADYSYAQGFNSAHAGGAHFLFADGSVRFIQDSIDGHVYENLGAMADGNVIPDF